MKIQTQERSNTGVYHAISIAIKDRKIFFNDEGNEVFIKKTGTKMKEML